MNLTDIDAAIIDLDGTLVDTLDDFCVALNAMLGGLPAPYSQHTVDRTQVAQWVGKGSENLIKTVLAVVSIAQTPSNSGAHNFPQAAAMETLPEPIQQPNQPPLPRPMDQPLYEQAWASYQRHYLAINGQNATVFPGVMAGLLQLKARGLKLACLTNKPTAFAVALLQDKGLNHFFEFTFGGDSFERKKPDPLPLLKTCEALRTHPTRTLMLGDSSNDALAARAAGCPVWLVTYGYNHGQPIRAVDADGFIDSLATLG
jgi:phosphoglycolate phosphatase